MANTNGSQSLTKSMNGLIELEDGGGTVLSDGIVTTNKVITNNIQGQSVNTLPVNLFITQTGAGNIIIGNVSLSRVFVSSFVFRDYVMSAQATNVAINLFVNQTGTIALGTTSPTINIGTLRATSNALNLIAPSNIASLFTTQTGSIVLGNETVPLTVGAFKISGSSGATPNSIQFNGLTNTPINLFTTQTDAGTVKLGNPDVLLEFGGFTSLYFSAIQKTELRALDQTAFVSLFSNNLDSIEFGNANINMFIGSFFFSNKKIRSITPTDLITLFDNQTSNLIIGNQAINIVVGSFNFLSNSIQLVNTTLAASFFTTNSGPVVIGNPLIQISVGRFAFLNSSITTNSTTATLDLFLTHTGTINIGGGSSAVNVNTPAFHIVNDVRGLEMTSTSAQGGLSLIDFHSASTYNDFDARIISFGGTPGVSGSGAFYLSADGTGGSININTPTLRINNNLFRYVPPTSYTPSLSTGSCPNRRGSYSITGSMMTVHITFNTVGAAGTAGTGIYGYGIPAGFTIRTVPYNNTGTNGEVQLYINTGVFGDFSGTSVGNGCMQARGASMATTCVVPFTNNTLAVYGSSQTAGVTNWHSSGYYQFSQANLTFSFSATFPIN